MPRTPIDFSEAEGFEPLEKGEYECVVAKTEYREATEEGKFDYINVELEVTESGFEQRKLWTNMSFSPKALWMTKENFEALGVYEEQMEVEYDEDTMEVTYPEMTGLPVKAVVSVGQYNNRPTNNVDRLIPIDSPKAGAKKASPAKKPAGGRAAKPTGTKGRTRQFK